MIDPTGGAAAQTTPTTIYDGGPRSVTIVAGIGNLNNSAVTLVAAAAGLRTKVVFFRASCTIFTTAGNLVMRDGAGGASIGLLGMTSALAQVSQFEASGLAIVVTSVNTLLEIFSPGNLTVHYQLLYYQAP